MPTAWDLIGYDGPDHVRIKGGRALYEAVMFNDANPGEMVKLARIDVGPRGLREVSRWVHPDTELEIVFDKVS